MELNGSHVSYEAIRKALVRQSAEELRTSWQCRCLAEATGRVAHVIMAVLRNEYNEHMPVLLRIAFPNFVDVSLPTLIGCAAIARNGKVICRIMKRDHSLDVEAIYDSQEQLRVEVARLADTLKLLDTERVALFEAVQRWVVMDARIDHMGERKAS
jgi:hypothetical protein